LWTGEGGSSSALGISLFWGLYSLFLIFAAVAVARERRQVRQSPRLARMIPGEIRFPLRRSGEGSTMRKIPCVTRDLSETGVSLMMPETQILPLVVQAALFGENGDRVQLRGMVMRNDTNPAGEGSVGVHFMKVPDEARRTLVRLMFSHPRVWESPPLAGADVRQSLIYILLAPLRTFVREKLLNRYSPRVRREIPCQVRIRDRVYPGTSEDVSVTGMRLSLAPEVLTLREEEMTLKEVIIRLHSENGRTVELPARIVWKETHRRIIMGVRFLEEQPDLFPLSGKNIREEKIPERSRP
ncbi:MAG: PilZ domain-containing protein, partial [Nitrospirae bacterium]|nr:PilZ domain-containing protein [Nitrospirota bacterium]